MKRLNDLAKVNERYGTATWGEDGGWYWYQDNVEATALALMAQLRDDKDDALINGAVRWLLSVRKGGKWKSTRDTAFALYALTEYLKSSGELSPDIRATVTLNGRNLGSVRFTRENLFSDEGSFEVSGDQLRPGKQTITISTEGDAKVYYDAFLTYFSLEEPIKAASTTIEVQREYNKITRSVNDRGAEVIKRSLVKEGDLLESGDEIEVSLTLKSENNYEYLVYEDYKPAGCEPMAITSGRVWGSYASNVELRDEKVVFFISWLPRGEHTIRYLLRAETPGEFHALPTNGYAMYAPDIRAISDEKILTIQDTQ
jgi:hypothetical protein